MTDIRDPSLGPAEVEPPASSYDALLADVRRMQENQAKRRSVEVFMPVGDTGFGFRYGTYLDWDAYQALRLGATDDMSPVNAERKFGIALFVELCTGMHRNVTVDADGDLVDKGERVSGSDGKPLTWAHPDLQRSLGAQNATDAVKAMYGGLDGVLLVSGQLLLAETNLGSRVPRPTKL